MKKSTFEPSNVPLVLHLLPKKVYDRKVRSTRFQRKNENNKDLRFAQNLKC